MNSKLYCQPITKLSRTSIIASALVLSSQILSLPILSNLFITAATAKTACSTTSLPPQLNEGKPTTGDETIDGKSFVVSRIIVKAKLEKVWQVLTDYKHAPQIFPILKKCELLESHGTTKISRHEIAPSGIPDTFEYILEVHESAPTLMQWHRISGDFKEVDGSWKLEPINAGNDTLVTYASHVTGGFFMPQILIKHQAHIDMPSTMVALKTHTEHSVQIAASTHPATAAE